MTDINQPLLNTSSIYNLKSMLINIAQKPDKKRLTFSKCIFKKCLLVKMAQKPDQKRIPISK